MIKQTNKQKSFILYIVHALKEPSKGSSQIATAKKSAQPSVVLTITSGCRLVKFLLFFFP